MNPVDEVLEKVVESLNDVPEAYRELAQQVAKDAAFLAAVRLSGGEPPEREVANVKAQAALLSSAAKARVQRAIAFAFASVLGRLARAALL